MYKVLKYSFYDLVRSRWSYIYFAFYLSLGFILLFLNSNLSKSIITLMNIVVFLAPMIGTLFGIMHYYSSREFTELLLAQPIRRRSIFLGQYLGVSLSLSACLFIGLGIPFLSYGIWQSSEIWNFGLLIIVGCFLTFIFVSLSMIIGLRNENRIKGFSYVVLLWLFMAVIYDGIFLIMLLLFQNYPLDTFALISSIINPIDLSRIIIILKLDISALMGYTGAIFQKFFGAQLGFLLALVSLILWTILPTLLMIKFAGKKDF